MLGKTATALSSKMITETFEILT